MEGLLKRPLLGSSTASKKKNREITVDVGKINTLTEILYSGLKFTDGRYSLTQKFTAELPQTLEKVVAQLEQQLEDADLDATAPPPAGSSQLKFKKQGSE